MIANEAVIQNLYPWAYRLAVYMSRSDLDADDLVQDAFLALISAKQVPAQTEELKAWLRVVMVRRCIFLRHRMARELRNFARFRISEHAPAVEAVGEIRDLLDILSPQQRACVVLRYVEDLPEERIATTLGIAHGTVKAHLAQARAKLRAKLQQATQPIPSRRAEEPSKNRP